MKHQLCVGFQLSSCFKCLYHVQKLVCKASKVLFGQQSCPSLTGGHKLLPNETPRRLHPARWRLRPLRLHPTSTLSRCDSVHLRFSDPHKLETTDAKASAIIANLIDGTWASVEVVKAFCPRLNFLRTGSCKTDQSRRSLGCCY